MAMWHLLVASLLIVSAVEAAVIQFNTTVDCSTEACDLSEARIWIGGIVPSVNDTVEILLPADGAVHNFTVLATNASFQNFFVQNILLNLHANLQVAQNFTATDSNVTIHQNVTFLLLNSSFFLGATNVSVLQYGSILNTLNPLLPAHFYFDTPSSLEVYGRLYLRGFNAMKIYGSVVISEGAKLDSYGFVEYAPRFASINSFVTLFYVTIPDNSDYIFPQGAYFDNLTIGANSTVTIMQVANIWSIINTKPDLVLNTGSVLNLVNVPFVNIDGYAISLPSGSGQINVINSGIYFVSSTTISNMIATPISFSGPNNTAYFGDTVLQYLSFSEDAYVQFIFTDDVVLINQASTTMNIPGDITVSYNTLYLNGSFSFSGGMLADAGKIVSTGHNITFGDEVVMVGEHAIYYSQWNVSGVVTAPKISLHSTSQLHAVGNLQINGFLNNTNGTLQIDSGQFVLVNGEYNQGANANFSLLGLDNSVTANSTFNTTARLAVSHNAEIAGQVLYTYSDLPNNSKYPILQTLNGTINGTFASKATAIAGDIKTLDLEYSNDTIVYLLHTGSSSGPRKLGPLVWYWWVVIAGGVLLIVVVIIIIAVRSSRKGYEPVRRH